MRLSVIITLLRGRFLGLPFTHDDRVSFGGVNSVTRDSGWEGLFPRAHLPWWKNPSVTYGDSSPFRGALGNRISFIIKKDQKPPL